MDADGPGVITPCGRVPLDVASRLVRSACTTWLRTVGIAVPVKVTAAAARDRGRDGGSAATANVETVGWDSDCSGY